MPLAGESDKVKKGKCLKFWRRYLEKLRCLQMIPLNLILRGISSQKPHIALTTKPVFIKMAKQPAKAVSWRMFTKPSSILPTFDVLIHSVVCSPVRVAALMVGQEVLPPAQLRICGPFAATH